MPEPRWHTYECRVRWSDVDAYAHVNNVKYVEFYQEARIAFLSELIDTSHGEEALVLARLVIDYKRPVFFRAEPYVIRTRVVARGSSSVELAAEITDGVTVLSTARAVMVAFDAVAKGSRRLTEAECAQLDALIGG